VEHFEWEERGREQKGWERRAKDEQDKTLTVASERAKVLAAMDSCGHPATARDHTHPPTAGVFGLVAPSPGDHHIGQLALKVVDCEGACCPWGSPGGR
jgi:hypothetical protein